MSEQSAKPYLIRAICEWCADNSLTPYLAVKVDRQTRVPTSFVLALMLAAIAEGRTVIIIAHRLSAVRPCNRIITVEMGEITEAGDHDSLLALLLNHPEDGR